MKKIILAVIILVVLFGLIQLIPNGRNHNNPDVVSEPNWDSPNTREIVKNACLDCHSNESIWPWSSNIAPISWLVYRDVVEGRSRMNFSDWTSHSQSSNEISSVISEGEMPPFQYIVIHRNAILDNNQKTL